ncbi:MAG TPA: peptidase, partial [Chloroflexi bacterium]|nr:peptidase [Chloroflexota bacterium]
GYLSPAQPIEFPTTGGKTAHALYYAPRNRDAAAPEGELPPLLVFSHGGPTGQTTGALNLSIQYWTSRGLAVVDVNYGGSTGYGREYRERLKDNWGIVDVDDCANAARYLAGQGLVDGARMAIRGGSAGGYTTLAALTFTDVFAAGASHFGISDLETMTTDTHKFESRYLDGLVGPYPEARDIYLARSPAYHTELLSAPMIIFQGLEDKVVPPSQAEAMVAALDRKGLPYAYLAFEGEQHGFRRAENISRTLEAELYFYGKVFGFQPSDEIEPVMIVNEG